MHGRRSAPSPPSCPRATACASTWSTTRSTSCPPTPRRPSSRPTLTADRFVQLAPAYTGGAVMADGAEDRAAGDRDPGRARPDLPEPLRPHPGARPQRRQQERLARPPCSTAGAKVLQRQRPARQPDDQQPVRGRADVRRRQRAAVRLGQEHVAVHHHARGERPVRRRVHRRPHLGSPASCPASAASSGRSGGARQGRRHRAQPSCTTTRALRRDGRRAADRDRRRRWPSRRTSSTPAPGSVPLGLDNLALAYDNKTGVHRLAARGRRPNVGDLAGLLCDIVRNSGTFREAERATSPPALRAARCKPFSRLGRRRPVAEPRPASAELKLGGTAPVTTLGELLGRA